jgi:hypothetical protein
MNSPPHAKILFQGGAAMLTVSRLIRAAALTLCAVAMPIPTLANEMPDASDLSLRTCGQLDIKRSIAVGEGKEPERSPLDRACVVYASEQSKLPRHKIALLNLSEDARIAQCLEAFFAIAPDGTQYETDYHYKRQECGTPLSDTPLKCKVELTLAATDGTHQKTHEEFAHGLTRLIAHETGQWVALLRGQFACVPTRKSDALE